MHPFLTPLRLTAVAKWLLALPILCMAFVLVNYFLADAKDTEGNPIVFFAFYAIILMIGAVFVLVADSVSYHLTKRETFANEDYYRAIRCALWWTATGIVYFCHSWASFLFAIAGFLFLIFAFFLWLEAIRQGLLLRRATRQ